MQTATNSNTNFPETEKLKIEMLCRLFCHLYFSGQMRSARTVLAWLETADTHGFVFLEMEQIDYLFETLEVTR